MPKADHEAILAAHERTQNMKEVSRQLGYSYATVVQVVNNRRGLCQCGNPLATHSLRLCEKCLIVQRRAKSRARSTHAAAGVCLNCGHPRDDSPRLLCRACRERRLAIEARYRAAHGRTLRVKRYNGMWTLVMERDAWECQVCGEPARELHHLNEVASDHRAANLVALCKPCHLVLTRLNRHPNIPALLALLKPAA